MPGSPGRASGCLGDPSSVRRLSGPERSPEGVSHQSRRRNSPANQGRDLARQWRSPVSSSPRRSPAPLCANPRRLSLAAEELEEHRLHELGEDLVVGRHSGRLGDVGEEELLGVALAARVVAPVAGLEADGSAGHQPLLVLPVGWIGRDASTSVEHPGAGAGETLDDEVGVEGLP